MCLAGMFSKFSFRLAAATGTAVGVECFEDVEFWHNQGGKLGECCVQGGATYIYTTTYDTRKPCLSVQNEFCSN